MSTPLILAILLLLVVALPALARYPDDLPPAEKEIAGTVDPWGLPFSDALMRFEERFKTNPAAAFAVGATHDLVKIWPNKYWFRGDSALSAAGQPTPLRLPEVFAAAGETQAFQIAILPRLGATETPYTVELTVNGARGELFHEVFVKTAPPGYPRYMVERWPDPLVPVAAGQTFTATGADCAAFWVDVKLPARLPAGTVVATVKVSGAGETASLELPIRVVPGLKLQPTQFPLVAWFRPRYGTKTLNQNQMVGMAELALDHHLQAMDILKGYFRPEDPREFDEIHSRLAARGQNVFELERPGKKYDFRLLYDHIKAAGWLDQALIYSKNDEPLADVFYSQNVPDYQEMKQKYPGLKMFLASAYHEKMETGCDIWMTDLSTCGYDPEGMRSLKAPILWHYYCHLPIHIQFRAPLTMAPNMEVDNEALQHRLALWMSDYYGAKGVFIWAGFSAGGLKDDFWQTLELESKPGGYPYGGIHNGNNFLVYPPQSEGGPVLPSVRLKVLRDGMEDLALLRAVRVMLASGQVKGAQAARLKALLDPTPALFVHPQYWDRLPETLLTRRAEILKELCR